MREIFVAREDEMADGDRRIVIDGQTEIGVFQIKGEFVAWRNECPHQGGPVCQGKLMKGCEERLDSEMRSLGIHYREGSLHLVCPWHGFEFDARTGKHAGYGRMGLASYPVNRRNGDVYVVVER
jgi:nitrite reductase (NADH) small subunit